MNEAILIEKLKKVESLFAGATTEGERLSAERARQRILLRLQDMLPKDPPIEYKFTFRDMWSRKVFVALLRRYELKPYRYRGQRYTTVMVQVPESFVEDTLWPEFNKISPELEAYLQEVTDRVVKAVLHEDSSDAVVVDQPLRIGLEQSPTPKDPMAAEEEKPDIPEGKKNKGDIRRRKKKKRKKKKRNR
jgi:tRNA nucleotidyltransferase (CCA-adding enzyme)